jgi:ATP-dependent Lon protease
MHDLLDALRKKTDAKYAENKIKQRITAQSKEKSPKQIADHKKYFLGDLLQKWMQSRFKDLNDDQVLDAFKRLIENEKIGSNVRKQWTDNNQNVDWMKDRIEETQQIKQQIDSAKSDPRNPFKKN